MRKSEIRIIPKLCPPLSPLRVKVGGHVPPRSYGGAAHGARGKPLTWDITVPDTYAESHLQDTACRPGAAANKAAANKSSKYCDLAGTHLFFPIQLCYLRPSVDSGQSPSQRRRSWGKSSLALPASLASAASTLSLHDDILTEYAHSNSNFLQSCLADWSSGFSFYWAEAEKYANIGSQYLFAPIAVETLGPLNTPACQLFGNLGRKISSSSGDDREGAFLFEKVSVQRFNALLLHDSLPTPDCME